MWLKTNTVKSFYAKFQLTHPSRGVATTCYVVTVNVFISTHTPLARCGLQYIGGNSVTDISTHTPLARCGRTARPSTMIQQISTHTPLARCGGTSTNEMNGSINFNSHTPREVWLLNGLPTLPYVIFQLTHPSRGVAQEQMTVTQHITISTHTPLARCGRLVMCQLKSRYKISTHTPLARCGC